MGSKKQRKLTSTRLLLLWADWVWFEGIKSHKKSLWSFWDVYSRFLQTAYSMKRA